MYVIRMRDEDGNSWLTVRNCQGEPDPESETVTWGPKDEATLFMHKPDAEDYIEAYKLRRPGERSISIDEYREPGEALP